MLHFFNHDSKLLCTYLDSIHFKIIDQNIAKISKKTELNTLIKNIYESYTEINNQMTCTKIKEKTPQIKNDNHEGGNKKNNRSQVVTALIELFRTDPAKFYKWTDKLPYLEKLKTFIDRNDVKNVERWINQYGLDLSTQLNSYYLTSQLSGIDAIGQLKLSNIYNNFISVDIHKYVEQHIKRVSCFTFLYDRGQKLTVNFNIALPDISLYQKFNTRLGSRALLMLKLANDSSTSATLTIILSTLKKRLPWNRNKSLPISIGPKEVNTGSSYVGHCGEIFIWRLEELEKVLSHEMCHCLAWDNYPVPDIFVNECRSKLCIPLDTAIKPCETWVEMWGLFINCIANSYHLKEKIASEMNTLQYFYSLYKYELKWQILQVAKILCYFGFESFADFYQESGFLRDDPNRNKYHQSTSVISYYIFKASLWLNLDKWFDFHQGNYALQTSQWPEYQSLIFSCLSDDRFRKLVDNGIIIVKKLLEKRDSNSIELHSFRMTCVEVGI